MGTHVQNNICINALTICIEMTVNYRMGKSKIREKININQFRKIRNISVPGVAQTHNINLTVECVLDIFSFRDCWDNNTSTGDMDMSG